MSGTSLDGLDLCYVRFEYTTKWRFHIVATTCVVYDKMLGNTLAMAHKLDSDALDDLNKAYGRFIGTEINAFLVEQELERPDLVCSHGHTVFHEPAQKLTLQIGDGKTIAQATGITCVSDFRSLDVSLGGQGAPLVPIGDKLLFSEYEACLNLGGFSNISFSEKDQRRAFDICPVNIALNLLANKVGKPFDENGLLARNGKLNTLLLRQLNSLSVYNDATRPSLAREWLEREFLPLIESAACAVEDKLHTIVEHAALQICTVINAKAKNGRVLVTGGGAKNSFLIERIAELSNAEIVVPDAKIVDYKEALIFALLGVLRIRNEINVLQSVTGGQRDSCSGVVHSVRTI